MVTARASVRPQLIREPFANGELAMINQCVDYRLISPRIYGRVSQTPTAPEESLENVNEVPLFDGSMCIVGSVPLGPGGLFVLSKASALVVDNLNVLPTYSGVGRWIRLSWNPVMPQAREMASWEQFGQILIPAGTLEATPVVIRAVGAGVVTAIGYDDTYIFEATAAVWGTCTYEEGSTITAGMKFEWDLNGDGTYETAGARIADMQMTAEGPMQSLVLRERRSVTYAALGTIQVPFVRLVGWDAAQAGGWATAQNVAGGAQPNSLEFVYGNG